MNKETMKMKKIDITKIYEEFLADLELNSLSNDDLLIVLGIIFMPQNESDKVGFSFSLDGKDVYIIEDVPYMTMKPKGKSLSFLVKNKG